MTVDRIGQRYGRLTVIERASKSQPEQAKSDHKRAYWVCRCACGSLVEASGDNLRSGNTSSCGCSRIGHGMSKYRVHGIWRGMLQRCENPNKDCYFNYGGRGIKVCDEWHEFETFYGDMGDPPHGGTLERKENDGPYAKWNCKWASRKEQLNNKRNNVVLTAFGRNQTLTQWAEEIKMPARTLHNRLFRAKMSVEDALTSGSLRGKNRS